MIDRLIDMLIPYAEVSFGVKAVLRLIAAGMLGGFIGNDREHINRPAGIRTHILVCIGAALTVITSEFVCVRYQGAMNVDPTRLGAQVVSGIGFLGAGTILKEGFSVKGLTTAASLWAVSCVGLALGAGFYAGGIAATLLIFLTLRAAKHIFMGRSETGTIAVKVADLNDAVPQIAAIFRKTGIIPINSEILVGNVGDTEIRYLVALPSNKELFRYTADKIKMTDGVLSVHCE